MECPILSRLVGRSGAQVPMVDFDDQTLADSEDAANATFNAHISKGVNVEDSVKAGLKAGATVAGTAACAATGVGAVAAPLCGWLAGEVIGPIVDAFKDLGEWIGDLFSNDPPPPILIEPKDLIGTDPKLIAMNERIYAFEQQAQRNDVILFQRFEEVVNTIANAVKAFGQEPDADRILGKLAENLELQYWGNFGWSNSTVSAQTMIPPDMRDSSGAYEIQLHLGRTPPKFASIAEDIARQVHSGAINPDQCFDALQKNLDNAAAWSSQLNVEAARIMMLVALGDVARQGFTTIDPSRIAPHAPEPFGGDKAKMAAYKQAVADARRGIFPESYLRRHGIVAGVQFLRV